MKKYFVFTLVLLILTIINITSNAQTISSTQTDDPLCFGSFTGNSIVNINQTSPATDVTAQLFWLNPINNFWIPLGSASGPNNNFPFPNLGSGDYRIDLKNTLSGNLLDDTLFTLVDPPVLTVSSLISNSISCYGYSDGSIDISVSGGTGGYTYLWDNTASLPNGATTSSVNNLLSGTYGVTITDVNGCILAQQITINQPNILQVSGFVSQNIFGFGNANGEITAQVTGGTPPYIYSIDNGAFTPNNLFQNLSASTYLIEYEDSNSCIISQNIILSNPGLLNGYATILSPVTCNGACDGSLKFVNNNSGNSPYSFSLNGGLYQSSNIFNNLCGDSVYYISIMDSQNAILVDTIYLPQPTPLLFSISSSFPCNGGVGSISFSNPTGGNGAPISYSFDGGITFIQSWNQSALQAGTYSLAIQDALGCITYDSTVLTEPSQIQNDFTINDVLCYGDATGSITPITSGGTPTGGNPPYIYSWGGINPLAVPAGTYSVTITDANGCSITDTAILDEPDVLSVTSTIIDNLIPFSSLAAININILGGTEAYTITWDGPNNFSSTDSDIDSLISGFYYLNVIDSNSCVFQDTLEIIDPIALFGCTDSLALNYNSSANIDNGMCYYCNLNYNLYYYMPSTPVSCDGWMSVYVPLGSYPINYYWSNGGSSWSITGLCNDTFSVTIIDNNSCGADTSILLSNFVGCMDDTMFNYDPLVLFNDSSCVPYVFGCTDSTQFNYDALANTSDGSCEAYVYGCDSINAANYNPLVNTNDGSCWYCVYGCMDQSMFNFDSTATCNDSCITVTYGCIDSLAINYDILANTSDGSCIPYLAGCTDIIAINFDVSANIDDGSCCYVEGCTDSTMYNYSSLACFDDSSCIPFISGCTDSLSFNYDSMANVNDTSCYECSFTYHSWLIDTTDINTCGAYAGINNLVSINSSSLNYTWSTLYGSYPVVISQPYLGDLCLGIYSLSVVDDMGCVFSDTIMIGNVILGCTDSTANNYDSSANVDNASCCAASIVDLTIGNWYFIFDWACPGNDTTYYINFNADGTWSNSYTGLWQLCGNQYTHTYFNDQTVYTGIYSNGVITGTMTDGISSNIGCFSIYLDSSSVIFGCTDTTAFNYDPTANLDDGSCVPYIYGCTNPLYVEYIATANTNDGSCLLLIINGCIDPLALNYDTLSNTDDGTCCYVSGCMDPLFIEYNALACMDDGTCLISASCGAITGVNFTDLIHDRVQFNWNAMNTDTCVVDQIRIRYREVGTSSYSNKTMGAPVGNSAPCLNTSKLVLNLTASTQYEYDFKIWYQNGSNVNWHANGTFTTADVCINATNMIATTNSNTQANFCWDAPVSPWSFVRLQYRENVPGSSFSNIGGFGVMSPAICKTKNGLTAGAEYRVLWRTWCSITGGPYRSPVWDGPVIWTQPTSVRLAGGSAINNLAIYPNPSRDVFNVSFTSENIQDLRVRILNVVGEVLINDDLQQFIGEYTNQIDLSNNAKGIYFLEIETNDGIINKKLILQ